MYLSQAGDDWSCGVGLAVWSTAVEDGNAMFSALQFGIVYFSRLGLSLSYFLQATIVSFQTAYLLMVA